MSNHGLNKSTVSVIVLTLAVVLVTLLSWYLVRLGQEIIDNSKKADYLNPKRRIEKDNVPLTKQIDTYDEVKK